MHSQQKARPRAVLVSVQLPEVTDEEHAADLAELARLVDTLGYAVAATITQKRSHVEHGAVLGEGKLQELAALTGGSGRVQLLPKRQKSKARLRWEAENPGEEADFDELDLEDAEDDDPERPRHVVVDHDITPSQARNLERATGAEVLDRTGVIIEIFHRHAKSREAKLEVEIARLNYVAPRLREAPGKSERQRGKGAGESNLELDRRKIRDRIAELKHELAGISNEQNTRRAHRHGQSRVALVGYTNAGKSSLMRALTGSQVLVADKLFATLDTTVRALYPESKPRILVSDTVGFIKKLPHDLVASFRSTLDEALEASLLLYVADASDPTFRDELAVTRATLAEIGADVVPSLLLLNKIDKVSELERRALAREHPNAIMLSAKSPDDIGMLRERIVGFFEEAMTEADVLVPYSHQALVHEIHEAARVVREEYGEEGATLRVRAPQELFARWQASLARPLR